MTTLSNKGELKEMNDALRCSFVNVSALLKWKAGKTGERDTEKLVKKMVHKEKNSKEGRRSEEEES